ncbi:hypothetical protein BGZ73_004836 [Actinomortierella ambigua]|nr:hypothetical protein BGZ73_004836 [Actinomortierella ambigua]
MGVNQPQRYRSPQVSKMEPLIMTTEDIASFITDLQAAVTPAAQRSQQQRDDRLRALQLQLGVMLKPDTFACKLACSEGVSITFVDGRRKIRIHFKRGYGSEAVDYQMELKVQDLGIGCITVEDPSYHKNYKNYNSGGGQNGDNHGSASSYNRSTNSGNSSNHFNHSNGNYHYFNHNSNNNGNNNSNNSSNNNNTTTATKSGDPRNTWITISMKIPPAYWRFISRAPTGEEGAGTFNRQSLRRAIDLRPITSSTAINGPKSPTRVMEPAQPDPPSQNIKLGKWLVARLEIDSVQHRRCLNWFLRRIKEFNLYTPYGPVRQPRITSVLDHTRQERRMSWQEYGFRLRFDVHFMLESALSYNYLVADNITPEFMSLLSSIDPLKACSILENVVGRRARIWNPLVFLKSEVKRLEQVPVYPRMVPNHNVLLRKVVVTPTTMYLIPPTIETSNRIMRKFQEYEDFFLRVEFADEGPDRIWSREGQINVALFNRIFTTLVQGVKIGDRLYEFLAFSSSQLRENAAWFFCSDGNKNPTPHEIRCWMGDFSRIKSIAKYGARMGQCFSSTKPVTELTADQVKLLDDIERDGTTFSDGCGMISVALAEFIQKRLDKEVVPSAFQIRLGGSKGVLAVAASDPQRRHANTDFWVGIRPSMNKFDSGHYVLEVIKTSHFIPSYLNRQIVVLLSALGVPDKVFLDLKDQMVREFDQMDSNDLIAYRILAQQWDESGTYRIMSAMIKAGFLAKKDIFLRSLLKLCRHQMLEDLAKRARIFVPQGAYLLGVVDETGTLQEDEIFLQISSIESPNKWRVIEQTCMIVRSPCFHPGDIRVVRAVDNPRLRHLHDVVVFNTKGRRSLPNMCSGGDLDGDEFTIIWDPTIVQCIQQDAPMDYKGQDTPVKHDITIRDVQSFFVQHAVANNLGLIANAHLAFSDQLPKGPFDGKCLRLAQLHSDAVDFPKTGKPAEINEELRPKKYPDFMGKSKDRSYRSERILGILYRDCGSHESSFDPLQEGGLQVDERLLVDGYTEFLDDARQLKERYDNEMRSLTNHYGVRSDVEIVSGFITEMEDRSNKREYETRQTISKTYSGIRKMFRAIFDEEFQKQQQQDHDLDGSLSANTIEQRIEQKASAWYAVSYMDWQPGQYYTFGWIVWDILCRIAERKSRPLLQQQQQQHLGMLKLQQLFGLPGVGSGGSSSLGLGKTDAADGGQNQPKEDAVSSATVLSRMLFGGGDSSRLRLNNPMYGTMDHAIAVARARLEHTKQRQQAAMQRQQQQQQQQQQQRSSSQERSASSLAPLEPSLPQDQEALPRQRRGSSASSEDPLFSATTVSPAHLAPLSQDSYDSDAMDLFHPHSGASSASASTTPPGPGPLSFVSSAGSMTHTSHAFPDFYPSRPPLSATAKAARIRRNDAMMNQAMSDAIAHLALLEDPRESSESSYSSPSSSSYNSSFPPLGSTATTATTDPSSVVAKQLSLWDGPPETWPGWSTYNASHKTMDDTTNVVTATDMDLISTTLTSDAPEPSPSSSYLNASGLLVIGPDVSCEELEKILDF